MKKNGAIEAGELSVNGHWGYEVRKVAGDYVVSCSASTMIYFMIWR